jgi:hypothetical protein
MSERRSLKSIALEFSQRDKRREDRVAKKQKRQKFGAVRVKTPGQTFDSKLEHAVFQILKLRERAGEIKNIRSQVTLRLTLAKIGYRADFTFEDCKTGDTVACEAKGDYPNAIWDLKKRLYKFYGKFKLEIWKGLHTNPQLVEVITPVGDAQLEPDKPE